MGETTIKGEIVKEYLQKWPNVKNRTLARKIHKENPLVFNDIEEARFIVRSYRGKAGDYKRKHLEDRRFVRDETIPSGENPYNLPDSDALTYPIFKFPKAQNNILVASDAHCPYHDPIAITAMLDWARARETHKINTVLLNGDWMDCHRISSFVPDPRKRDFKGEREVLWRMLDAMQNALPDAVFYYRQSNHERRYERFMMTKAPEIFDTEEFRFDVLMKFGERGIIYIGDKLRVQAGSLTIIHGDEYNGSNSPVNAARGLFLRAKASAMCGHSHQVSEHSEVNINGDIITCWSVGTLSEMHPEYAVLNRWSQGFARVLVFPDETFQVTNLRIDCGSVL